MFEYKTVLQKAAEWSVPVAQIQSLCRQQKIEGAQKHGGIWFIPDQAINPFHESDNVFPFKGTKKKIFVKAVRLFAQKTFERVTIKEIAEAVGVAPSAVYNHFQSKQEILDTIYGFFEEYFTENRPAMEEIAPILGSEPIFDVLHCMDYGFKVSYEEILLLCIRIIFMRALFDERAGQLFRGVVLRESREYVREVYDRAIATGEYTRFDTDAMSEYHLMCRVYLLLHSLFEPSQENMERLNKNIYKMDAYVTRCLENMDVSAEAIDYEPTL
ncbi:MAG: TetR/AcrR family transcriptional regulator [Christensenella sp.]|uniref:TetR/AcrR family transcriptional regulator n=1 Tax=Christensenella sp. TaxID=1935934 RepID=UPI002B1EE26C|nr:TetR/AcrR family transcriptional regulator [Christensenella sp.]MEA5004254.1 TetR/AcrR family transcriptional regulator [Christensenella sp.]